MRGVILAGGTGSRLMPATKCINKHLLPVGNKPMIFHAVDKLVSAGIDEIMIITGTDHMGMIVQTLGSGKEFGCHFMYAVQDTAFGIPDAINLARIFCGNSKFCVVLGDNIFTDSLSRFVDSFEKQQAGSQIILKKVPDLDRFGVAFTRDGKITGIVEKPKSITDHNAYAIIGVYFYTPDVFEIIQGLRPSARNELEVTDIHNEYLRRDQLEYSCLSGPWTDAGTFSSLARANAMFR